MSFEIFSNVLVYLKDEIDTLLAGKSDTDHTHASSIPAGVIVMWSGTLAAVPAGWALCDGAAGTPDLRDKFIKGWASGVNPGGTGGNLTHSHAGHSNHLVTQPAAHSNHLVTQPTAHSDHVVTDPVSHAAHQHAAGAHTHPQNAPASATLLTAGAIIGATGTVGGQMQNYSGSGTAAKIMQSGVAAGTGNTANPSATLVHSGTAVDPHSPHSGAAVDAHSAHTGAAVDAHSAHDSPNHEPPYFKLAFIMKL